MTSKRFHGFFFVGCNNFSMETRRLETSDPKITPLGIGAWLSEAAAGTGVWGPQSESDSVPAFGMPRNDRSPPQCGVDSMRMRRQSLVVC